MKYETDRQKAAYRYYFSLGDTRTITKVANKFDVGYAAVMSWSKKYNWEQRVKDELAHDENYIQNRDDNDLIHEMETNRKIIKASLADFIKRLKKGEIQVNRIKDAVDLLKLDAQYVDLIIQLKNDEQKAREFFDNKLEFKLTVENK